MLINCPECNREISDKATACPNCGYAHHKTAEKPVEVTTPPVEVLNPPSITVKLITLGVIMLVVVLLWRGCMSGEDSATVCDAVNARVMAEQFVENRLKSPDSASFSREPSISSTDKKRWTVISYVDSQNSFGASIRTKFQAVVICKGDGNWTLENLAFE